MKELFNGVMLFLTIAAVMVFLVVSSMVVATVVLGVLWAVVMAVYAVLRRIGVVKPAPPVGPLDSNGDPWIADIIDVYEDDGFLQAFCLSQKLLITAAKHDKPKHNERLADLVAWDVRRRYENMVSVQQGLGVKNRKVDSTQSVTSDGRVYDGVVNHFVTRLGRKGRRVPALLRKKLDDLYSNPKLCPA